MKSIIIARVFALVHQLGDELTHALVAPAKNLCVVPVLLVGALLHELEVANERFMAHGAPRLDLPPG